MPFYSKKLFVKFKNMEGQRLIILSCRFFICVLAVLIRG